MDAASSITIRLEAYLIQLSSVNERWMQWLREKEQAVVTSDRDLLERLTSQASQLMTELEEVVRTRTRILDDAGEGGLPNDSLSRLARSLPAWKRPALRRAILTAKLQITQLQRLHAAAWVLIHETAQFYTNTMQLLVAGQSQQASYVQNDSSDTGGGQLLDTDL